jgi:hypothetical protein
VKLVCGEANVETPGAPVAWGQYWTAINIHNPDKCKHARFRTKIAVANPIPFAQGPVSQHVGLAALGPDHAFEIDCQFIKAAWPFLFSGQSAPNFVKGYVVIESDHELDVVAVYTAAPSSNKPLTTFQTERVPGRCVPVCEDLVLPLHTGIAAWQTVTPTAGQLGPAVLVTPPLGPPPPAGSQWISQFSNDGTNATTVPLTKYYELCFELCSGFTTPSTFPIQVKGDDQVQVFLNNTAVTGIIPYNTMATPNVPANLLRAGINCFRVEVKNTNPTATGFALAGTLNAANGKCPCTGLPIAPSLAAAGHGNTNTIAVEHLLGQIAEAAKSNQTK